MREKDPGRATWARGRLWGPVVLWVSWAQVLHADLVHLALNPVELSSEVTTEQGAATAMWAQGLLWELASPTETAALLAREVWPIAEPQGPASPVGKLAP